MLKITFKKIYTFVDLCQSATGAAAIKKNLQSNEKHRRYGKTHFTSKNLKNLKTVQNNVNFLLYFKNRLGAAAGQPEDFQ